MKQVKLDVTGMSCGHCVHAVKEALAGVDGVNVDEVSIGKATVSIDEGRVGIGALIDAVADAGYEASEAA
ncbi:MAG TPA: heavy-metal-associated domain-containing protein [Gemmatimonadaceae bacterium]